MRPFWTIIHRWAGLAMAGCLIVAGLTGSLLAFYSELDGWLNADLMSVRPNPETRQSFEVLVRSAETALPGYTVTGLSVSEMPDRSVTASIVRSSPLAATGSQPTMTEAFVDPYDGRFLGARDAATAGLDARRLMPFLYSLHTSLHLPGVWGVWLMGGAALIWFFDNFVGAYLTFPPHRRTTRSDRHHNEKSWLTRWKPAWRVKIPAGPYRLQFDLHRASGLWIWTLLGMLALSSVYLNLGREVFNPVLGIFARVTPYPEDFPKSNIGSMPLSFTVATELARQELPVGNADLRLSFVGYDRETDIFRVGFGYPDTKTEWFNLRQENVFIEGKTGRAVARFGNATATGAGDAFNTVLFPLHSGQIIGLPGRIIISFTGFAVAVLSVTGVVIWRRKWRARLSAKRKIKPM